MQRVGELLQGNNKNVVTQSKIEQIFEISQRLPQSINMRNPSSETGIKWSVWRHIHEKCEIL